MVWWEDILIMDIAVDKTQIQRRAKCAVTRHRAFTMVLIRAKDAKYKNRTSSNRIWLKTLNNFLIFNRDFFVDALPKAWTISVQTINNAKWHLSVGIAVNFVDWKNALPWVCRAKLLVLAEDQSAPKTKKTAQWWWWHRPLSHSQILKTINSNKMPRQQHPLLHQSNSSNNNNNKVLSICYCHLFFAYH